MATHLVTNQVPDLSGHNGYTTDPLLQCSLARLGGLWHEPALLRLGERLAQADVQAWARDANRHPPELVSYNRQGERVDEVRFHPAWHSLLALLRQFSLHALPFTLGGEGVWLARCAGYYLAGQNEAGSLCPTTMTLAGIPLLQREALFAQWGPGLLSNDYDASDQPRWQKRALTLGMGLTEKQGGSDLRGTATVAVPQAQGGRGGLYQLSGHKWFFSAPTSDAHLVLARCADAQGALSCFLLPRWRADGSRNAVQIQRLKDKLGNRSNASGEAEFDAAEAYLVGEPGRGVALLLEMASYTRLDCVIGSAALLRQALVQALHHARHRMAFGRQLAEQPLMCNVLADLALESEAATLLMLQLAAAFDRQDPLARAYQRIVTPIAKYWVCKRAIAAVAEAMEVCGGNGYVEEGVLARLYREAPVNSIWEGAGNVMCLDVLRAVRRDPAAMTCLLDDLASDAVADPLLREALARLRRLLAQDDEAQQMFSARVLVQTVALLLQGVLLRRHALARHADVFIATRCAGMVAGFGVLSGVDTTLARQICADAWPA